MLLSASDSSSSLTVARQVGMLAPTCDTITLLPICHSLTLP